MLRSWSSSERSMRSESRCRCGTTTTASGKATGSALSTQRSAASPPQEAPITRISRSTSAHLPVQLLVRAELLVAVLVLRELERLLAAQPEHAEVDQAVV